MWKFSIELLYMNINTFIEFKSKVKDFKRRKELKNFKKQNDIVNFPYTFLAMAQTLQNKQC